jgi:hypothetical protein
MAKLAETAHTPLPSMSLESLLPAVRFAIGRQSPDGYGMQSVHPCELTRPRCAAWHGVERLQSIKPSQYGRRVDFDHHGRPAHHRRDAEHLSRRWQRLQFSARCQQQWRRRVDLQHPEHAILGYLQHVDRLVVGHAERSRCQYLFEYRYQCQQRERDGSAGRVLNQRDAA